MTHFSSNSPQTTKTNLTYLPLKFHLKTTKECIVIDRYRESDREQICAILKEIIDAGQSFTSVIFDEHVFERDVLPHDYFLARCSETGLVVGSIRIKANSTGRSSHIGNGRFAVKKDQRGKGIGEILYKTYLRLAKDLGYEASLFPRLGFVQVGTVPKTGKLKDIGYSDSFQFYYDLTTLNDVGEPVGGWPK